MKKSVMAKDIGDAHCLSVDGTGVIVPADPAETANNYGHLLQLARPAAGSAPKGMRAL